MKILADFNVSANTEKNNNKVEKVEGTMYFYAPEICMDEAENEFDAFPLDIWALGVTLFCLVYLELPFSSPDNNYIALIERIAKGEVKFPNKREISEGLKELILLMLEKDPSKRITCKELKKNLWVNKDREDLDKQTSVDLIKVSEEEIENTLDFFLAHAKDRNYSLMWKTRATLKSKSNSNRNEFLLKKGSSVGSDSSNIEGNIISIISISPKSFKTENNKNGGGLKINGDSNTNSCKIINKKKSSINKVDEDDFFNN